MEEIIRRKLEKDFDKNVQPYLNFENGKFKRDERWRNSNKFSGQFTDEELNDFYASTMINGSGKNLVCINGLVYMISERFFFPQNYMQETTEDQNKLLQRVVEEYAKRLRDIGFKVYITVEKIPVETNRNMPLIKPTYNKYRVYRRETLNSDITKIPYFDKMYFDHLTKFTRIPMKKIFYNKR